MKRILILQTSFLGDVILSTPVIYALSKKHPDAELWMLTTPAAKELISADPLLKGVLTFDKRGTERSLFGLFKKASELKSMKFDAVYSLHKSARTSLLLRLSSIPHRIGFVQSKLAFLYSQLRKRTEADHDVLRNLSLIGDGPWSDEYLELRIIRQEDAKIDRTLKRFGIERPFAVIAPGSAWETKMWRADGFRELGKKLIIDGLSVVVIGDKNEELVCDKVTSGTKMINLCKQTRLDELTGIIQASSLVVCNDSMPLHLASALKIPTVTIFCATSPKFGFGPWRNKSKIVEATGLSCKPCSRHGTRSCPTGTEACMNDVTTEMVYKATLELIQI